MPSFYRELIVVVTDDIHAVNHTIKFYCAPEPAYPDRPTPADVYALDEYHLACRDLGLEFMHKWQIVQESGDRYHRIDCKPFSFIHMNSTINHGLDRDHGSSIGGKGDDVSYGSGQQSGAVAGVEKDSGDNEKGRVTNHSELPINGVQRVVNTRSSDDHKAGTDTFDEVSTGGKRGFESGGCQSNNKTIRGPDTTSLTSTDNDTRISPQREKTRVSYQVGQPASREPRQRSWAPNVPQIVPADMREPSLLNSLTHKNNNVPRSSPIPEDLARDLSAYQASKGITLTVPVRPFKTSRAAQEARICNPPGNQPSTLTNIRASTGQQEDKYDLPDHLNCALFLASLPPTTTAAILLSIVDTGAVYTCHIRPPTSVYTSSAAKLVFMNPSAAKNFMRKCRRRYGQSLKGQKIHVVYDRHGASARKNFWQSRVLQIHGRNQLMSKMDWVKYAQDKVICTITHTRAFPSARREDFETFEIGFARVDAQAEAIWWAIKKEPSFKGVFEVEYARDPCDLNGVEFEKAKADVEQRRPFK